MRFTHYATLIVFSPFFTDIMSLWDYYAKYCNYFYKYKIVRDYYQIESMSRRNEIFIEIFNIHKSESRRDETFVTINKNP